MVPSGPYEACLLGLVTPSQFRIIHPQTKWRNGWRSSLLRPLVSISDRFSSAKSTIFLFLFKNLPVPLPAAVYSTPPSHFCAVKAELRSEPHRAKVSVANHIQPSLFFFLAAASLPSKTT